MGISAHFARVLRRNLAPPLFIEFIGLPGAGKTALATEIENRLRAAGIATFGRTESLGDTAGFLRRHSKRLGYVIRAWILHPVVSLKVARMVAKERQPGLADLLKLCWNFWTVLGFVAAGRRGKAHTIVLDQGLLQAVWSIRWSAHRPLPLQRWAALLNQIGLADFFFVLVEVPTSLASDRVSFRNDRSARIAAHDPTLREQSWQKADSVLSEIRAEFLTDQPASSMSIENIGAIEPVADKVIAAIAASTNHFGPDIDC